MMAAISADLATYTISDTASLIEAATRTATNGARTVIVLNENSVIGVLSEGDILRALINGSDVYSPLSDHLTTNFKFMRERDMDAALELFRTYAMGLVPILNDKFELTDVVTLSEMLYHFGEDGNQ